MKLSRDFFINVFDSSAITPSRLRAFGKAVLANLSKQNKDGEYTALIATLTKLLGAFSTDVNDIDEGVGSQKISSKKLRAFLKSFVKFMTKKAPFIAEALGGEESDGYLSFYPSGVSEYYKANYSNMETLTGRVKTVANQYKEQLGATLAEPLVAFEGDFEKMFESHAQQTGTVKKERAGRTTTSLQLQLGLTTAVFTVAALYPGNGEVCEAIFPFGMLYPQVRRRTVEMKGELAMNAVKNLMNYTFSASMDITIDNTGSNSDLGLWLGATETDARPAKIVIVKAGESHTVKVSKLGNLEKPFLMIANLSAVNPAAYTVTVIGLRKEPKAKKSTKKEAVNKQAKEKMDVVVA